MSGLPSVRKAFPIVQTHEETWKSLNSEVGYQTDVQAEPDSRYGQWKGRPGNLPLPPKAVDYAVV
jgi:hypothetical protein